MSVALFMLISTKIPSPFDRIQQYVNGLNSLFQSPRFEIARTSEIVARGRNPAIDLYIMDNTVPITDTIDDSILSVLPENVTVINDTCNTFGAYNKGAGCIEQWRYLRDHLRKYQWIIHFEPRMQVERFDMFDSMLDQPRNLFTTFNSYKPTTPSTHPIQPRSNDTPDHINTGIFMIRSDDLLKFIDSIDLIRMVQNSISLEYLMFDYMQAIPYDVFPEGTGVLRHDGGKLYSYN